MRVGRLRGVPVDRDLVNAMNTCHVCPRPLETSLCAAVVHNKSREIMASSSLLDILQEKVSTVKENIDHSIQNGGELRGCGAAKGVCKGA